MNRDLDPIMTDLAASTRIAIRAAFAKAPPWLASKGPTILIRAGSHAAGVALPTSDVDLRGVAVAPKTSYLGFAHGFERFVSDAPDCEVQMAARRARIGLCHTEERLADLAKITMHAVRLSRTVREVLDWGALVIRRPDAADLLAIRGLRDLGEMARICAEVEGGIEGLDSYLVTKAIHTA